MGTADGETPEADATTTSPRALPYIPALDGLRAVAVVGVMLFHGGISWMPGGFLGVDVFFVLSGYLITTLLLRERVGTGRIDLRAFWVRRLRRLLPALLVLLAVVAVASPFLLDPAQRTTLRGDGLAALGYVANWRFVVTEQSYFSGTPSPLRHLWSLAVEEQWYVAFPVVVALALRRGRRAPQLLLAGLVAATAASVLWMAHLAAGAFDLSRAYYGTDARAHSLLVGAILAVVAAQWPLHRLRRTLALGGLLGAGGVAAAYLFVHESDAWMYRGGFLALALATAALVAGIALPRPENRLARVLAVRPLVAVGKVSYGLYLWHWPVNVALTPRRLGLDGDGWWEDPAVFAVRTTVAVAFTVASYVLVEVPVRRHGLDGLRLRVPGLRRSRPAVAAMCVGLVAWLLVAGTFRIPSDGSDVVLPVDLADATVPELPDEPPPTVPPEVRRAIEEAGLPPVPADRPVRVMVVGDSVAYRLTYNNPPDEPEIEMSTAARIGCGTVPGFALVDGKPDRSSLRCGDWLGDWQIVAAREQPDVILLHFGAWEVYDHRVGTRTIPTHTPEMVEEIRGRLDRGLDAIRAVKPDVRFMFVAMACMREENPNLGGSDSPRNDDELLAWVNGVFRDYFEELGDRAAYVDLGDLLCPGGEYRHEIDGKVIRNDGVHYQAGNGAPVWAWLADKIVPFARTPVAPSGGEVIAGDDPSAEGTVPDAGGAEPPA